MQYAGYFCFGIFLISFFLTIYTILFGYKKIEPGKVMIRSGSHGVTVSFNSMFAVPLIHKMELMDITVKIIPVRFDQNYPLECKNNELAYLTATLYVQIYNTEYYVKMAAQNFGCERASNPEEVTNYFRPIFIDAVKTVAKESSVEEIKNNWNLFRDNLLMEMGEAHNGFVITNIAIEVIEKP